MIADALLAITPIYKILYVFLIILVLNRLRLPLGIALLAGGIVIDLWAARTPDMVLADLGVAMGKPEFWLLLVNISLILEFGYFMATEPNSKVITDLSQRLGGRHGRTLSLVLIPASIGLIPMPGGALFSAPLVGETVKGRAVDDAWKASVNYWFRHIFEYWWPLYPVVIVTLSIFDLKTWQFFALMMPFTFVSLAIGWFVMLRPCMNSLADPVGARAGRVRGALQVVLPIGIVVLCTLLLPSFFDILIPGCSATMDNLLGMFIGLVMSLVLIWLWNRHSSERRLFADFGSSKTVGVVVTLGGVMLFQALLESSGLLSGAGEQLGRSAVPVELIIGFLPFLAGLVTGIAIGFSGPAFPLLVGISAATPHISQAATLVLGFAMGYAGMMISPMHLCYILTRKHFMVSLTATYKYIIPAALTVMVWGVFMHVLVRMMGW